MKPIKAHKLKVGDSVGIISPSEPIVYKNEFFAGIKELEKLGLKVVLGKNIFKSYGGYMAGTIKERLHDFHSMIKNPKIKALFISTGGFCVNQILPLIDYSLVKKILKLF